MNKKYIVRLDSEEHHRLEAMVKKGRGQAYKIKHANILLAIDTDGPNWTDKQVAEAFRCHLNTVANVRQRFVEYGLEGALERKEQESPSRKRILDGEKEARLITIACSKAPSGRAKWTLEMLADELVALQVVESVSEQTVWRTLKKTKLSRT
ncbi:MAG: helix-turn-helix domain-containing protein [bacterium]|nr:helix-turn-helix domain-containing protein [bacterium]